MRAFVTGMGGFIGSHLADFLLAKGFDVYGTFYKEKSHMPRDAIAIKCDISKKNQLTAAIRMAKPEYVFHMAAQSFVVPSWKDPEATMKSNVLGTLNLLEALKNKNAIICIACSSAEYGFNYKHEIPVKEDKALRPSSPYAVSKVATDMISYVYYNTYGTKLFRLRYFNTVGPRKTGNAVGEWAQGIAEIEAGKRKDLHVGNLKSIVDITDIRDAVKATWILTKKGKIGDVYNICTGKGHKMKTVLEKMIRLSNTRINTVRDPKKFRPLDDPIFIGNASKLKRLGWEPKIPLEKTLQDTIDYWRNEIK